eukprot:scaffold2657_cov155-Skeletonema_marinoi.AAC.1
MLLRPTANEPLAIHRTKAVAGDISLAPQGIQYPRWSLPSRNYRFILMLYNSNKAQFHCIAEEIECNTISSGETQRSGDQVETKWRPSGDQVDIKWIPLDIKWIPLDTTGYHWIPADTKWISIGYQMDTKWMLN